MSLAVAASSCFPPFFPPLVLNHTRIGLNYDEFKGTLILKDGGVFDNLGVKVLLALRERQMLTADLFLICDAERPQYKKPSGIIQDINAQGVELSEAAKIEVERELGEKQLHIGLSKRTSDGLGLPFTTQTLLHGFRTDLDIPSWREIDALLLHEQPAPPMRLASR